MSADAEIRGSRSSSLAGTYDSSGNDGIRR
jgi:hypothetical protein